jgi:hypothetical protein
MNKTYNTNQKPNHTGRNIAGGLLILGAAIYGKGVYNNSQELSDKLAPVRADFEKIVKTEKPVVKYDGEVTTFEYGGKLDKPVAAKNQFAKDNGAFARRWDVGHDVRPYANTPSPIAYNPFKWHNKINDIAIKNYQKNNHYRMKK